MKRDPPAITSLKCLPAAVVIPYADAFTTCAVLPAYALVQVRASLARLVEAWLRAVARGTGGSLSEQVERLVRTLGLPPRVVSVFDHVRIAGNLGAHPEQRTAGPPARAEARDALRDLHEILSLYAERVGGVSAADIPGWEEPPDVDWGEVCERAVLGDDARAMLAVGRRLANEARQRVEDVETRARVERATTWTLDLSGFHDALYWFDRARRRARTAEVAREALYERAHVILVDVAERDRLSEAVGNLRHAAQDGHADAQALLALLLLDPRSPLPAPRDLAEAREWAERAAAAEHPEALNALTAIYANGQGVEPDPARALGYARRASQAGYPLAHANLALLLLDQDPASRDEAEIRALIERAKADAVGDAYWAEYRLLAAKGSESAAAAAAALDAAVAARALPALVARAQRELGKEPIDWDIGPLVDWLLRALAGLGDGPLRAEARALLVRVRDESDRRMRNPSEKHSGPYGDDLFSLVIRAGANLDLRPGQDAWHNAAAVIRALQRACAPIREPATKADVELVLAAVPTFPLRWTRVGAELVRAGQARTEPVPAPARPRPPSRNGPCPCGSGRKYKGCHGKEPGGA